MRAFELLLHHVQDRRLALSSRSHQRCHKAFIRGFAEQGGRELVSEPGTAEAVLGTQLDRVVAAHRAPLAPLFQSGATVGV
jgi:hypothetical protein